ncbi:hypothetical protein KC19_2G162300 [Ceratodon purpureus]|uniref:RING-type domain-containing protein n=1 Tax=Ceratodon purpureus TaxID=3225 RepID=A0A8T0IXI1_CERPU|nr:hypothetical protein KC19_2G162300 [Ceratodon purpureus]KAG0587410.1 hypothetical protein KC19_2G162300 [Ceratodon purpureus]KAG0587411.1 hypothetical protein KC19_2G162300 [Ceratodon purpureus]KAG0587412.1 hypothetical protein KC19_2G162300 [Ceratodon purpureus]
MIGTPIAFGLTMIVCFTLFYYYWRIRQLRARLLSAQTTPVQELDFPVEFGIGKNVVETFPTIKACELKCTASEDLQCPICLVEYEEWEVLRQLPFCGHIFHTLCVGAWFEKQTTCPVCRMSMSELTESFGESLVAESIQMHCRRTPPSDVTVEVVTDSSTPSWTVHNRRLPLPVPPVPAMTTEGTLTSTHPSGIFLSETETQPKTASEDVQVDQTCSADFHVVNIPQEEWRNTCSKCKAATKPIKTVTSDDPEMQQQSDVPIRVFQTSVQRTGESNEEESLIPQEALGSQEISGWNELPTIQPIPDGAVNINRCDSDADGSSITSVGVKVQEDVQTTGSFEFQPVLTADGGLTFRATTL